MTVTRGDVLRVRRMVEARSEIAALYAALYTHAIGSYDTTEEAIRAACAGVLEHQRALDVLTTEDERR